MALLTVEGVYRDGRVELEETPPGVGEAARVLVTFLPAGDLLERPVTTAEAEDRERMRQRAFKRMEEGIPLGGPPYPKREELYDRFDR